MNLDCIVWEITLKCNARCIHCGSNAGNVREFELTTEKVFNIIDQIENSSCKKLNLLGGEIFLRDDWKEILLKLDKSLLEVSIITNGIALTPENIDFLIKANVKTVGISIDGATVKTSDQIRQVPLLLATLKNNIKVANQKGLCLSAITTFNKFNILELPLIRNFLLENNVKIWQVQIASSNGRMKNEFVINSIEYYILGMALARYRSIINKNKLAVVCNHDFGYYSQVIPSHSICKNWKGCPAGISTLGIRSDGKVQGCLSLPYDEFAEFDLNKNSLEEIWNSCKLSKWNKKKELVGFCKTCKHKFYCQAGCSDMAYSYSGSLGENPNCYYRIEKSWMNTLPQSDFEAIFKDLTTSKFDDKGNILIKNSKILSEKYLSSFELSDYELNLLELLYS